MWFAHPSAILGRSEYFGSYGQAWYNPYSILRISMPFDGVTGHPSRFVGSKRFGYVGGRGVAMINRLWILSLVVDKL